jgi:hypothetical protein
MRAIALVMTAGAFAVGGCSLLFNGNDLKGKNGGGGDMAVGGGDTDMGGGGTGGTGGGGGTGGTGGGGGAACTPLTMAVKFTKTTPSVAATGPYEVVVADIDHDGKLDIVTANYNSSSFSVLLGDGAGGFTLAPSTPVTTCTTPQLALAGDFTGDGLPDVVISCYDQSVPTAGVSVYVNQSTPGSVSFSAAKTIALASQMHQYYIAAGQFDGDGKLDLMLDDGTTNIARLLIGAGDGTFTAGITIASVNHGANYMTVGRLNNDTIDDVIIVNYTDDNLTMLLSKPGGGFTSTTLAVNAGAGTLYYVNNPVSLADVNKDGLLDILVASATTQTGTVEKFLNTGTAAAPAYPGTPTDIITGDLPMAQGLADFNCDGTLDIAVSTNGCHVSDPNCPGTVDQPPNMWLLPGLGTSYDTAITTGIPVGADSLAIADLNNDGYPDIVAGAAGTAVTVLMNAP